MNPSDWPIRLASARKHVAAYSEDLAVLNSMRDEATAQVLALGRGAGVELNPDAVKAAIDKPYVLVKTDDPNTWKVITWRGRRDMPVIGWIDWQDDAFIVSTINRAMRFVTDMPAWMVDQIGWQPPEFAAALDPSKTLVQVTQGNRADFQRRYGAHLAGGVEGGFKIKKGRAWIELLERMLHDGIVPFTPKPVQPEHWNTKTTVSFTLRDYQVPYIDQFRRDGAESIILPSGAGKTMVALFILAHIIGHSTILCDSDVLVGQWKSRVKEYVPHSDVEILTFQAAMRRIDQLHGRLLVTDECFPAGTLVDGKPIESIRPGDSITAWDERKRRFTAGTVTRIFKRSMPHSMIRITSGQHVITCTGNHPILTQAGWRVSSSIREDDLLLADPEQGEPYGQSNDFSQDTRMHVLQPRTCPGGRAAELGEEHGANKSQVSLVAHDGKQPNETEICSRQDLPVSVWREACQPRREWETSFLATEDVVQCVGRRMENRVCGKNPQPQTGLPRLLQIGHCKSAADARSRGGWEISRGAEPENTRPQKGRLSIWTRVDRVEVLESGSKGQPGTLPSGDFVYNLEVAGYHTYTANGIVVHNCHRLPADTWSRLAFTDYTYHLGMTATPWRLKRQAMVFALGGPPRVIPWKQLIDAGVLNRPSVQVVIVPMPRSNCSG